MENLATNSAGATRDFTSPAANRRRRVRHKVHTPAYASLNSSCEDRTLELHEVLNISEDGLAIQTSAPLTLNETVDLCLDLSETGVKIKNPGRVVWLNEGKAGICFSAMSSAAQGQVKEWLFVNTTLACVYRAAEEKSEAEARAAVHIPPSTPTSVAPQKANESAFPADYTSTLAALAAVEGEVAAFGSDLDRALRLVAERAIAFTHATGAAVALTDGPEMVCRGSAGPDAPSLGVRFNIGAGFSGECVRTGRTLRCEDSETDPLVDKESCRALGVRCMVAVPIRSRESIIGLLEIFSPKPAAFGTQDETVLQRLAEMVSRSVHRAGLEAESLSRTAAPVVDDELYAETQAESPLSSLSTVQKILLIAAALTVVAAVVWLLQPWHPQAAGASSGLRGPAQFQVVSKPAPLADSPQDFAGIRKLAEQGDAAAQFAVGAHYATGEDVPQDYAEAVRWFTKAAEQGHVGAQATLGAYYWSGRGVPQDLTKAYFWAILAQTGGDDASKYRVVLLSSRMSRQQIVAAQQQANQWIKEHESSPPAVASSRPK